MSLQLIFVVETRKSCNSDWIYIKETVDHFYQVDQAHTKLSVVYMDSKGTYESLELSTVLIAMIMILNTMTRNS